jgi:hypothetical protein
MTGENYFKTLKRRFTGPRPPAFSGSDGSSDGAHDTRLPLSRAERGNDRKEPAR